MRLTQEQQHWQARAREFTDAEIAPIALARDRIADPARTIDWRLIRKGSEIGFRTMALEKRYGGQDLDIVTQALVLIELGRGDVSVAKTFSQCSKWTQLIQLAGTEEQKERFLPAFAADPEYLLGSASTEPGSGSDHRVSVDDPRAGYVMRAHPDGDEWVLDGTKQFIANGPVAKLLFVGTRTDRSVPLREGATSFLVEPHDTPGVRIGRVHDKIGWRFYQNSELIFEGARVPDANRVGDVNGLSAVKKLDRGGFGDLELAAIAVGLCDAAIGLAFAYAESHHRGGRLLIDHQTVQLHLSDMDMLTEGLRNVVLRTAEEIDDGGGRSHTAAMNLAAEAVRRVAEHSMEIHGRDGTRRSFGVEKLLRDASIWVHLAGDAPQRFKGLARMRRRHEYHLPPVAV